MMVIVLIMWQKIGIIPTHLIPEKNRCCCIKSKMQLHLSVLIDYDFRLAFCPHGFHIF